MKMCRTMRTRSSNPSAASITSSPWMPSHWSLPPMTGPSLSSPCKSRSRSWILATGYHPGRSSSRSKADNRRSIPFASTARLSMCADLGRWYTQPRVSLAQKPRASTFVEAHGSRVSCWGLHLRRKGRLVIDGVEGVLRLLLGGLHVAIPEGAARIRLARCEHQHLPDRHAGRTAEATTGVLISPDVCQVDGQSGDRPVRSADWIATQRRIAEVHAKSRREHLRFQHGIHRCARRARSLDHVEHVKRGRGARRRRA